MPPPKKDDIPEYLREYVTRSSVAMEQIAKSMQSQHTDWQLMVSALNQSFAIHNTKTEDLCKAIADSTKEARMFRTEVYTYSTKQRDMFFDLMKRVVLVTVGTVTAIAAGVTTLKILLPFLGG